MEKKNKLHYSLDARRDMDEIWEYIAVELENRSAAERAVTGIMDAVDQLEIFAGLGTPLSAIAAVDSEYRYLTSGNYMIFYRVLGSEVFVDRVLYGRRDYLRILQK